MRTRHPRSLARIRAEMAIPSVDSLRGQRDGIGFAREAEDMAAVVRASALPPYPYLFDGVDLALRSAGHGDSPDDLVPDGATRDGTAGRAATSSARSSIIGAICPHDDYLYAGRVYGQIIPLITARILVVVGVFHRYARFGIRNRLVFDPYPAWRTPDGSLPVAQLRDGWRDRLPPESWMEDAAAHDAEHSVEALAYWFRHERPDRSIVPVLIPGLGLARLNELAEVAGLALAQAATEAGLVWGRDIALAISADAVHYGTDFSHTPFGTGGPNAYARATQRDLNLMERYLCGGIDASTVTQLFETFVEPSEPDRYRLPWCGRFSIPFGLALLQVMGQKIGWSLVGCPVAYGTSIDPPVLTLPGTALGTTAPATLEHFVGHPAVALIARSAVHTQSMERSARDGECFTDV